MRKSRTAKAITSVAVLALAGAALAGCSSASTETAAESTAASSAASASPTAKFTDPNISAEDLATVRDAILAFEDTMRTSGGVQYQVYDPKSDQTSDLEVKANGDFVQRWQNDKKETEESRFIGDRVYTVVSAIADDLKKYTKEINPKAKWFSETRGGRFSPTNPARIVEAFLPYAKKITCTSKGTTGTECEIIASGMTNIPGIGGFETPETGVTATVFIEEGMINDVKVFPGVDGYERRISNYTFVEPKIETPAEADTVTIEDIGEYVAKTTPVESASPAPKNK